MWTRMVELLDFSKKEEIILVEEAKHLYIYRYNKYHKNRRSTGMVLYVTGGYIFSVIMPTIMAKKYKNQKNSLL